MMNTLEPFFWLYLVQFFIHPYYFLVLVLVDHHLHGSSKLNTVIFRVTHPKLIFFFEWKYMMDLNLPHRCDMLIEIHYCPLKINSISVIHQIFYNTYLKSVIDWDFIVLIHKHPQTHQFCKNAFLNAMKRDILDLMYKTWTLQIIDSIHAMRSEIAITNIFVWNLKIEIQNYFEIQL